MPGTLFDGRQNDLNSPQVLFQSVNLMCDSIAAVIVVVVVVVIVVVGKQ